MQKRRTKFDEVAMELQMKSPFQRFCIKTWRWIWEKIYYLVAMATYLTMVGLTAMTVYHIIYDFDAFKALSTGLCTLLIIYVNKVNPSTGG